MTAPKNRYSVEMRFECTADDFEFLMDRVADLVMEHENAAIVSERVTA